jgi:hypothetical protein
MLTNKYHGSQTETAGSYSNNIVTGGTILKRNLPSSLRRRPFNAVATRQKLLQLRRKQIMQKAQALMP